MINEDYETESKNVENNVEERKKQPISVPLLPIRYISTIIVIAISSIISGISFPLYGYLFSQILINLFGMENSAKEENFHIMWYMIAISIILFISLIVLNYSLSIFMSTYTEKLRNDSFSSLVYYDSTFFDKRKNNPHALSSILRDESQKTSSAGGPILAIPLLIVFSLLAGFAIAIIVSEILGPIYVVITMIYICIIIKSSRFLNDGFDRFESSKLNDIISQALSNHKTMSALNLQQFFYKKYSKEIDQQLTGNTCFLLTSGFLYSLRFGYDFITTGGFIFIGAYFIKTELVDFDDFTRVLQVVNSSTWVLIIISVILPDLVAAAEASKKIESLLSYSPRISSNSENGLKSSISGKIAYSNIKFSYPYASTFALNNCSFTVQAGKSVGITGKTGSGKSTLAMLLLRFYSPDSGEICIDDEPIQNYNVSYLRSRISWVGQEPVLFRGSILENLQLGNAEATRNQALLALEKAQAQDIIDIYGLDSQVGVRGSQLSGGQKQRIAIARAVVRNPSILILDEATSALDNITQQKVNNMLMRENITIIAILHKLETIRNFTQIIVIDKGCIVQQGEHKYLVETEGLYKNLFYQLNYELS